jgi:predicted lipid-binding transport protein (Tim44 family)
MARPGISLEYVRVRTRGTIFLLAGLLAAFGAWGRGGGGCLEEGTLIDTPAGPIPIERLAAGQTVWAVVDGRLQPATVQAAGEVEPADYVEIGVGSRMLRATAEHPLQTAPGTFRVASGLQPGDSLYLCEEGRFNRVEIETVARVKAVRPAFNLLVAPGGTYLANGVVVHNKGCFLPDTPIRRADGTETPISTVRPGDELLAFTTGGEIVHTMVRRIITYEVDEYIVVGTEQMTLRVTREHPFYVGNGTFKTLEALQVGDPIFVLSADGLHEQRITRLETVSGPTRVYNLQTDRPNTYFANGVAVHNKGGGCFPAGTRIHTPRGDIAIETVQPGDEVYGIDARGAEVTTAAEFVETTRSALRIIETDQGVLRTTAEHPLLSAAGNFRVAGEFKPGEQIVIWNGRQTAPATIQRTTTSEDEQQVYTLRVGPPHTFVADGFVVHNKGGGGFGGGFGGGGSGGGSGDPTVFFLMVGAFAVIFVISKLAQKKQEEDEDLDFLYSRDEIDRKAVKTRKLLEFLARVDQTMAPDKLEELARSTFTKLQQCWQARDYGLMQSLLMPDLYADHCSQLSSLVGNHEINRIDNLRIENVDIVNVRYPGKENDREFTALITASARDYYIDDRTQEFLRGDEQPARFQEFWTFHRQDGDWRLREIDQTRESDALKEENFFEQFTDSGRDQVYGDQAGQAGPAGPWLEKETETKATRTERLLNFLVQTDKLWDRPAMLERARQVFLHVTLAREQGDPAAIPTAELFPGVAASLQNELIRLGGQGTKLEFRNLCVRKVELVLVRNHSDNSQDEFTVRISAHAQKAVWRNNLLISQDPYVTPYTEFWTFGRLDNEWKLKAVEPPARGAEMIQMENVDEDSSPEQLQWYYQQTRAN